MTPFTIALSVCTLSLALAASVVPVVRQFARGGGLYEQPVEDRWHRRRVPKLGGVAMALVFFGIASQFAETAPLRALLVASACMCLVGLIDDFRPLRPLVKFSGQIAAAVLFLSFAPSIDLTGEPALDFLIAFVWFVGITNAFNLLDNIDGAAAGVAAIAGAFFIGALLLNGNGPLAGLSILVAAMTGVSIGFLLHNWHPASIFMGDSGSHLLGSFFAGATILAAPHMHQNSHVGVAIGVALLLVPCADTTLVILTRQLTGRSAFVGGRDHLSHRIVALGLNERRAVLVLYGLAVTGGIVALSLQNLDPLIGSIPAVIYGAGVAALGVYLGHVDVNRAIEDSMRRLPLPTELTTRYRVYAVLFDVTLVALAYYLAILLRFRHSPELGVFLRHGAPVLPVILVLHLAGLWLAGRYRKSPALSGLVEATKLLQGVAMGSAASVVAVLYITRFDGYSRQAFAIAGGLSLLFLSTGHLALRVIDDALRRRPANGPMAIVYGAGERGALVIREVLANRALALTPLALIDDDTLRRGERVEGVRVLGTLDDLSELLARDPGRVTTVIVSIRSLPAPRFDQLCDICARNGIAVQQFRASFEDVDVDRRTRTASVLRFPGA